jgi:hypothetical protein
MLTRLRDLRVREGSFVPRGDNPGAHIVFTKSETEPMDVAAIIALLKGLAPEGLAEVVKGAGIADTGEVQKALEVEQAKTADLTKALAEATAEPAKPEPTEVEKALEAPAVAAEFAKRDARIAELEKAAKDRDEAAEKAACLVVAKGYSVGIEDDKLAETLRVCKRALTADQYSELGRVLTSCTEIRKQALGATGSGTPVIAGDVSEGAQAYAKLEKAARDIAAAEKIPFAKAFAKACAQNPELYKGA